MAHSISNGNRGCTTHSFTARVWTRHAGLREGVPQLSQDIFQVLPAELPRTQSVLTVVGGKVVFDAGAIKQ